MGAHEITRRDLLAAAVVARREPLTQYLGDFSAVPTPDVVSAIPDEKAGEWLKQNVPLLSCPDKEVEKTYYYRWWTLRKHIRQTPQGYIFTEFLRPVKHATDYNAISCALGHHVAEARWLKDPRYLDGYLNFWLHGGENGGLQRAFHQYSGWAAAAVLDRYKVDGRREQLKEHYGALVADYHLWEKDRLADDGLFWQYDVRDGMEESISGGRKVRNRRPSTNSYMYGNALALNWISASVDRPDNINMAVEFHDKAVKLRALVEERLWNKDQQFFETLFETGPSANVREAIGFTPWMFHLPAPGRGYEAAWRQLRDRQGFWGDYGPTTAERRHPRFGIFDKGDDCQWNGPSWPFATSITLNALANVIRDYPQNVVSARDYYATFMAYTRSQRLKLDDGRVVPWIDENVHPDTGVWWARELKRRKGDTKERGQHYNHSTYCDLVISGLIGLRPRTDDVVEVHPLLPENTWSWFCLERIPYKGHSLTISYDRAGLRIEDDGKEIAHSKRLGHLSGRLRKA
jgi:hypothetical protein